MPDNDNSLGDQNTFDGGENQFNPQSLGDEQTFIGNEFGSFDEADDSSFGEREDLSNRYTIEGTLGKGGMGEVLLATDTRLGRKIALKRILGKAARSKKAIDRFITEAKSVAAVKHTNIVDIYDFGLATDGPYLTMEYVEGSSLEERCRQGPLEVEEAVSICCQLCDGLARAHSANIIHRDIKPANVLMTPDGVPKLTDFGLAKDDAADTGMTMAGTVLGTLDFMPPEQRKDAALVDNRSDLWSLAATLYQMVAGEPPRVIDLELVPQQLRSTLAKALKNKKDDRYQTAIELRDALLSSLEAPRKVIQTAVLGAGECPECHTQNESSRKFCSECAASLRVNCLKCEMEIPIWEKVCGECGGKQQELLEARIADLDQQKNQAEQFAGEYRFEEALAVAKALSAIEDDRFSQHREWSAEFVQSTKLEWDRQTELLFEHYSEAKKHRVAFDYDSAIQAIVSIPEPMRSSEVQGYLSSLTSERDESLSLIQTIRESIASRKLDDLLPKVKRALELRGDREDLRKLNKQLLDRQAKQVQQLDEAFSRASDLLGQGQAKAAAELIGKVRSVSLTGDQAKLQRKLAKIVAAENELLASVKEAKADGVIDSQEVIELLPKADAYLKLNPKHTAVQKLHSDLLTRLTTIPISDLANLPASVIATLPARTNSIGMKLKLIPGGTFAMGDGEDAYQVTLTKLYELGVYEVTQEQYERLMGTNPSQYNGSTNPVEYVSWEDAVAFCEKLSSLPEERSAGRVYRLPTEAEWEYACRAGTTTEYSFGDDESSLGDYAWYKSNSDSETHPVGLKQPNPWGLYDMHGNVWEWCSDWYGDYPSGSVTDPVGPFAGSNRVVRGGSWYDTAEYCRSANRRGNTPSYRLISYGFRVTCVPFGQ